MTLFKTPLFSNSVHKYLYIVGVAIMILGLPFSNVLMSISQFVLIINWVIEGDIKEKLNKLKANKLALMLISLFILHLLGLIYTCDLVTAWKDIRIKLPLIIFPLVLGTIAVPDRKWLKWLEILFIATLLTSTFCSISILLGFPKRNIVDIRNISVFISHIRLSLLICLAFFLVVFRIHRLLKVNSYRQAAGWALVNVWFVVFLAILESMTGFVILIAVSSVLLMRRLYSSENYLLKISCLIAFLLMVLMPVFLVEKQVDDFYKERNSARDIRLFKTSSGNLYQHYYFDNSIENSTYIMRNIQWSELSSTWGKVSRFSFDGKDRKGQQLKMTLIRFLSSKGLTKDREAVLSLNADEVKAIENGVCNVRYMSKVNIFSRLRQIIWELDRYSVTGNSNGYSVAMRLEFWNASFHIIKKHPLIGVGTGDVDNAFKRQYKESNAFLEDRYKLKSHNQYLRLIVVFGVIGFLWFLIVLIYPLCRVEGRNVVYITFFLIVAISMLTEDTIETQAGVSFYAFFNTFILFWYSDIGKIAKGEKLIRKLFF